MNQSSKELRGLAERARTDAPGWYTAFDLRHDPVISNPDAAYIAAASPDVVLRLLAVCDAAQKEGHGDSGFDDDLCHSDVNEYGDAYIKQSDCALCAALNDLGPIQP